MSRVGETICPVWSYLVAGFVAGVIVSAAFWAALLVVAGFVGGAIGEDRGGRMLVVWRVGWGSPWTEPPAGWPRVLAEALEPDWESSDKKIPEDLDALSWQHRGYTIFCAMYESEPRDASRRWSPERKARTRRQRLEKRLKARYPLFWRQYYDEELARRSLYYEGRDPDFDVSPEEWAKKRGSIGFVADPGRPYRAAARRMLEQRRMTCVGG